MLKNLMLAVTTMAFFAFISQVCSHGFLDDPPPRGGLSGTRVTKTFDPRAPSDSALQSPSGDKTNTPGAGRRSQIKLSNGKWALFEPMRPGFVWRAGVCGDRRDPRNPNKGDHMKGGKYYWPSNSPRIVKAYKSGGLLDASFKLIAHHNGFIEFHLCDVAKCPGREISEECFQQGHCVQLRRARNLLCDSGRSKECGPIDRSYPGRWYLPCRRYPRKTKKWSTFGPGSMKYIIPSNFNCDHCVLHMYWTGAINCNAAGIEGYFKGQDAPKWGTCLGEVGPHGWYTPRSTCGGRNVPEEYYQCADIAVKGNAVSIGAKPATQKTDDKELDTGTGSTSKVETGPVGQKFDSNMNHSTEATVMEDKKEPSDDIKEGGVGALKKIRSKGIDRMRFGTLRGLKLVSRGKVIGRIFDGDLIDGTGLKEVTFESIALLSVRKVQFTIQVGGKTWRTVEFKKPFRMFSAGENTYWENLVFNRMVTVKIQARGDTDTYRFTFEKK